MDNAEILGYYTESIFRNIAIGRAFPPHVNEFWDEWINRIEVIEQSLKKERRLRMNWINNRPGNWENPYESEVKAILNRGGYRGSLPTENLERKSKIFEAGADAMYEPAYNKGRKDEREALKVEGKYTKYHRLSTPLPGYKQPRRIKGWLVFIPDKE